MAIISIITYGCTANQDNSDIIRGILAEKKHDFSSNPDEADIIIVNTCIVKGVAANKAKSTLEKYKNRKIIITGCMPESEQKLLKRLYPQASLVNTFHITKINNAVDELQKNNVSIFLGKRKEKKIGLPKLFNRSKVSIQIAEGCSSFCSFCETKLAKGHIQSSSEKEISKELKKYLNLSYKNINITSTDNGCYGFDINTNLPKLLKKLASIPGDFLLWIGMMNPSHVKLFLDDLIEVYKNKKIAKIIHIPLQSGSNKMLKDMNRQYIVKEFKHIVNNFRKEIPGINIITDVIVGYPTETEEDFNQTLELLKELKPEVLNISKYAPRPGTIGSKFKQLPSEIIKERSRILTKEFKKLASSPH